MNTMALEDSVPKRIEALRILQVLRAYDVAPWLRRVTFGGAEMNELNVDPAFIGPHIKLLIPPSSSSAPQWPMLLNGRLSWPAAEQRPLMRSYSIRALRRQPDEIDVDFVLHGDDGPASVWAMRAMPGDIAGIWPGGRGLATPTDTYVLIGDETAIPAISYALETLPQSARGWVFLEVSDSEHQISLPLRPSFSVTWIHRMAGPSRLVQAAAQAVGTEGEPPFIWGGAEAAIARQARAWTKTLRHVDSQNVFILNYWRIGATEGSFDRYV